MQVVRHEPVTKGVVTLMYVGDAETAVVPAITNTQLALGAAGALLGIFAKSGFAKAVGWGLVTEVALEYMAKRTP